MLVFRPPPFTEIYKKNDDFLRIFIAKMYDIIMAADFCN